MKGINYETELALEPLKKFHHHPFDFHPSIKYNQENNKADNIPSKFQTRTSTLSNLIHNNLIKIQSDEMILFYGELKQFADFYNVNQINGFGGLIENILYFEPELEENIDQQLFDFHYSWSFYFVLNTRSIFQLIDLFIKYVAKNKSTVTLIELKFWKDELLKFSNNCTFVELKVEAIILLSKIELVKNEFTNSFRYLNEALTICDKKQLKSMTQILVKLEKKIIKQETGMKNLKSELYTHDEIMILEKIERFIEEKGSWGRSPLF